MHFTQLVPSVYYKDVQVALKTFVECLGFTIRHKDLNGDNPYFVLDKDGLRIMIFENKEYAEREHPEIRLVTNNIEEVHQRISTQFPELLHPNLSEVTLRPWGAKEFAMIDSQIGIRVQQW